MPKLLPLTTLLLASTACAQGPGPDVIAADLTDVACVGQVGGILGYGVGTNACNTGTAPVDWQPDTFRHPVIIQNIYRLKDGRFEHLGQSWAKHGFRSINSSFCGQCTLPPGGAEQLGVGCSDPYTAGLNAYQESLGPRSQINGTLGYLAYPSDPPPAANAVSRVAQVPFADVDPAQNIGAQYFAEAQYATYDDATAPPRGNALNNASWRKISMANPAGPNIPFLGNTVRSQPAIYAWRAADPAVMISTGDYLDHNITCRFLLGTRVLSNADGTYTYIYALQNLNADRAAYSFSAPWWYANLTSSAFHAAPTHSGEPGNNARWITNYANEMTWYPPLPPNPADANTLRWGTLMTFTVTTTMPPAPATATIGLFKPPTPESPEQYVSIATLAPVDQCTADFNHDGDTGTDADIEAFFRCLSGDCCLACPVAADINGDGDIGTDADIESFFRVLAGNAC